MGRKLGLFMLVALLVCSVSACASKRRSMNTGENAETAKSQEVEKKETMSESSEDAPSSEPMADVNLSLENAVIAQNVVNLEPEGAGTVFSSSTKTVYCFTKIIGAATPTYVRHVWFFNGQEVASVKLHVKSSAYRTYSTKNLSAEWVGPWRVEVRDPNDKLLTSLDFQVN